MTDGYCSSQYYLRECWNHEFRYPFVQTLLSRRKEHDPHMLGVQSSLKIQNMHPAVHLGLFSILACRPDVHLCQTASHTRLNHSLHPSSAAIDYPCRCLCRGFALHRIYTFPFRLTLRQCRHIFLTADRTFIPRNCCAIDTEDGETYVAGMEEMRGRYGIDWNSGRIRGKLKSILMCFEGSG